MSKKRQTLPEVLEYQGEYYFILDTNYTNWRRKAKQFLTDMRLDSTSRFITNTETRHGVSGRISANVADLLFIRTRLAKFAIAPVFVQRESEPRYFIIKQDGKYVFNISLPQSMDSDEYRDITFDAKYEVSAHAINTLRKLKLLLGNG